ncbi:helix-turn-helix transcriptional regulator [Lentzea sp. BCCO 10_0856]|uniref:Helix-turn-helix transcriptional regulator n=1 Tax=Lentzea miocenica TaxID=3095431 RepID=A0ABU4TFV7_9PSEU|nr:helix-turn-helix transcriptional regulator [Lentzea sp. BCCO 10_0856]MDX8036909.1 helix-turn-helix transcriptional regulator [Lentzea sp. BCCO 10_0856]
MYHDVDRNSYRRAMADTLKTLQEHSGLTYNETVKRARLGPGALGKFILADKVPSMETLARLCAALDVGVFWVLVQVYETCLAAQGKLLPVDYDDVPGRHELAAVLAFVGAPVSAMSFAHWCCNKAFGCRCAPQCTCSCAGCHLTAEEQEHIFEVYRLSPPAPG